DARLGARAVVQTETNSGIRRVLRGERPRQQTNGGNGERQRQPHFRNSGSKLKTTGKASSGNPSGNGPNASALAAASTAPCASRSKEKLPDFLMNVRSDTEPSRWIRNLTSALRRAPGFRGLNLISI